MGYLGARLEKVGIPGEATSFIKKRSARWHESISDMVNLRGCKLF